MRPFINREPELASLERLWGSEDAQLIIVYGRRRVGKTALVRRFIQGRPHLYFLANRLPEREQLLHLGEVTGRFFADPLLEENGFRDWRQVFSYLSRREERYALVVDEFPYLVEANPALGSLWQQGWDEVLRGTKAFVVLMGSSVSMMERETLDERAPLYGRRTGQLRLEPLTFRHARAFFPCYGFEDQARAYAVLGGMPYYLERFEEKQSLRANLLRHVLDPSAVLREEAEILLRQELQEPRVYFAILNAIAQGKRKLSEITNATALPHGTLTKYLSVLQGLRLVQREIPVTETAPEKSKKGLYRILDPYVSFWFRFVFRYRDRLEQGEDEWVADRILGELDQHVAGVYEEICAQAVREGLLDGLAPGCYRKAGRWWDRSSEIDLVALDDDQVGALFGECKWSVRPVGVDVLAELRRKASRVALPYEPAERLYALFSRAGFTPELIRLAGDSGDVLLVHGLEPVRPSSQPG
ncbi:MAG: ATP-binding protein [Acidobacteria bacterium]|nr:ATP-binding protein [Acidobacteriota bacterium]